MIILNVIILFVVIIVAISNVQILKLHEEDNKTVEFIIHCLRLVHIGEVNQLLSMASLYRENGKDIDADKLIEIAEKMRVAYNISNDELRKDYNKRYDKK